LRGTIATTLLGAVLAVFVAAVSFAAETPPIATKCRVDLAKRLGVKSTDATVVRVTDVDWPDAALGLPMPDMMYAQVITPGWSIILQVNNAKYLYTASSKHFRYGGPVAAAALSALYVDPIENEPNMNGRLIQVSLVGSNPVVLIGKVSEFYPQANGAILASRRDSRSGFSMWYLAPGEVGKAVEIGGGFELGDAVLSPDGKQWAGYLRGMIGADWWVAINALDGKWADRQVAELPKGTKPGRIYWENGQLVAVVKDGDKMVPYEVSQADGRWQWKQLDSFVPDEKQAFMLNKSESVTVDPVTVDGKPSTRVARTWFTGDEKKLALLPGFACKTATMSPAKRFVFLSGLEGSNQVAYTIDVATGEEFRCVLQKNDYLDAADKPALFLAAPYVWQKHPEWYGLDLLAGAK
jgi:hypothetical protein